jgi:hypothetical protein
MGVDYKLFAEHHLSASSVPGQWQASQDLHQQQGKFANYNIIYFTFLDRTTSVCTLVDWDMAQFRVWRSSDWSMD